jgi:hypothetical protein
MAMLFQCQDTIEPIADSTIEAIANMSDYSVLSGCAASYSVGNMVKTIASGQVLHGGTVTAVAGNTVTLVSDPTNPRWTWTYVNSSGTAAIVSGDPAATPAVPELGDNPSVSLDLVQAGQTIAGNITYKLDKRVFLPGPVQLVGVSSTPTSTTSTAAVDLVTISGLAIPVTTGFSVSVNARKQALAANAVALGLKINSTVWYDAPTGVSPRLWANSSAANQAETFAGVLWVLPRSSANYLATGLTLSRWAVASTGATATAAEAGPTATPSALIPNATITSMAIRGINQTASNALEVTSVRVLTGGI